MNKEILFKYYPFLETLQDNVIDEILNSIQVKNFSIGDNIVSQQQVCTGFSLILKGKIRSYRVGDDGREITLYRLKPGDICFVTILCILNNHSNYSLADAEEETTMAVIPLDIFNQHILNDVNFLKYVFKDLYYKFENVVNGIENITFNSIEDRIGMYFKDISKKDSGIAIIYTTHEKIAIDIGSSREVVSRSLKSMEKKNLLQLSRGKIKIFDMDKFKS